MRESFLISQLVFISYFQPDQNKRFGLRLLRRHIQYSSPAENQDDEKSESDCKPLFIHLFMKWNRRGAERKKKKDPALSPSHLLSAKKEGASDLMMLSSQMTSRCSFHPFLIGLTPRSQSQTASPWVSLFLSVHIEISL